MKRIFFIIILISFVAALAGCGHNRRHGKHHGGERCHYENIF